LETYISNKYGRKSKQQWDTRSRATKQIVKGRMKLVVESFLAYICWKHDAWVTRLVVETQIMLTELQQHLILSMHIVLKNIFKFGHDL
jgi:hypothetical protein